MGSTEKFCLRWNDFESNISVAFRELREEKDFFDVTLACEDSQVQAHKVILSACSPFFRNILRRNPHQHPLLYLKGVQYKELLSVLNFMYMGEVNVAQEELNSFLAVAEELRVKGLTQNNAAGNSGSSSSAKQDINKTVPIKSREPPDREHIAQQPKRSRPSSSSHNTYQSYSSQDDDVQEVVPVKSEPRDPVSVNHNTQESVSSFSEYGLVQQPSAVSSQQINSQNAVALDENYADESYDYGQYEDGAYDDGSGLIDPNTGMPLAQGAGSDANKGYLDDIISSKMVRGENGDFVCLECPYSHKTRQRLQYHIESKHVSSPGHTCEFCLKVCPTKNALCLHRSRYHKNETIQRQYKTQ